MPGRSADSVAAILREQIKSGKRPLGSKLPSQADIAEQLDATEPTVQRAIQDLRREGLVSTARGKGMIVTYQPRVVRDERTRYLRTQREQERGAWAAELKRQDKDPDPDTYVRWEVPPEHVREHLGTPEGEEVLIRWRDMYERVTTDDGEERILLMIAPSYIPGDIARGTQLENTVQPTGGMLTTIAEIGHEEVDAYNVLIPARAPEQEETVKFGIRADQPLTEWWHIASDASGKVVEVSWHRAPAHRIKIIYKVPMV